jgi:hypothetical protein
MPRRVPDVSRLEDLIGMSPQMDIADIAKSVVQYYRER